MLWSTLFNKIGKQPLKFTQHNHVKVVMDNQEIYLDAKYDAKGCLYLVRAEKQPQKG